MKLLESNLGMLFSFKAFRLKHKLILVNKLSATFTCQILNKKRID